MIYMWHKNTSMIMTHEKRVWTSTLPQSIGRTWTSAMHAGNNRDNMIAEGRQSWQRWRRSQRTPKSHRWQSQFTCKAEFIHVIHNEDHSCQRAGSGVKETGNITHERRLKISQHDALFIRFEQWAQKWSKVPRDVVLTEYIMRMHGHSYPMGRVLICLNRVPMPYRYA